MIGVNGSAKRERLEQHIAKVLMAVRARLQEALTGRITGEFCIRVRLHQGGVEKVYSEVGVNYQIQEDLA